MFMKLSQQTLLLFILNFLDGVLTIYWIHNGFATEGNQLMAGLMDIGYLPFLLIKTAIGAVAAVVLWHWRSLRLAQCGLTVVLLIYIGLMGIHIVTGLSACGVISDAVVNDFSAWSRNLPAFFS